MVHRLYRSILIACSLLLLSKTQASEKPNIILIFADDVGYGDLGCYGSALKTKAIDALADGGFRATDCLVGSSVCGPSRAALMTGRYPMRCGHPISRHYTKKYAHYGLAAEEVTVAEQLKKAGYDNFLLGKWHLGFEVEGSHPLDSGFDHYFGTCGNFNPEHPVYRNRAVELEGVPMEQLTKLYTKEAVKFIKEERETPFFLFFSHHIAHSPILPNKRFKGASKQGRYGDFMLELDESVAQVVKAVEEQGLKENTLIVFLSDNGPAKDGSAKPLSGGKYVTMEGGLRVPAVFYWPGHIPAGEVSDALITSMDLLPLFSALAGVALPEGVKMDGQNILSLLEGKTQQSPHQYFYYYNGLNLQAIRDERWKLHLPRTVAEQPYWAKRAGGNPKKLYVTLKHPMLFDLDADVSEKENVFVEHPEVVERLQQEANRIRKELGDVKVIGTDQRPHGLTNPNEKG